MILGMYLKTLYAMERSEFAQSFYESGGDDNLLYPKSQSQIDVPPIDVPPTDIDESFMILKSQVQESPMNLMKQSFFAPDKKQTQIQIILYNAIQIWDKESQEAALKKIKSQFEKYTKLPNTQPIKDKLFELYTYKYSFAFHNIFFPWNNKPKLSDKFFIDTFNNMRLDMQEGEVLYFDSYVACSNLISPEDRVKYINKYNIPLLSKKYTEYVRQNTKYFPNVFFQTIELQSDMSLEHLSAEQVATLFKYQLDRVIYKQMLSISEEVWKEFDFNMGKNSSLETIHRKIEEDLYYNLS